MNALVKSFAATAALAAYSIAKASGDRTVATAAAATDSLIGVTGQLETESGRMADLTQLGLAEVRLGGTVAFGDPLTADAAGAAIKAVPTTGVVMRTIGTAQAAGVSGDRIPLVVVPGVIAPLT